MILAQFTIFRYENSIQDVKNNIANNSEDYQKFFITNTKIINLYVKKLF